MSAPLVRAFGAHGLASAHGVRRETRNPSRPDEVVSEVIDTDPSEVAEHIRATATRSAAWREVPIGERARVLLAVAAALRDRTGELADLIAREVGKPVTEARGEVIRAADVFAYAAGEATKPLAETFAGSRADQEITVVRAPLGTVGIITPWNFPLAIPAWKIAPALVHGNTVVWKPSPLAPLTAHSLIEILDAAGLPRGVVSVVHGGGAVGAALVEHPSIDAVSFTGSTAVGRAIVLEGARRGIPVQAELGGKNSVIVCADADVDAAAAGVVTGAFSGNGQKCTATSRVIVDRAIAHEFATALRAALSEHRVGDAADPATTIGPLIDRESRDRVRAARAELDGDATLASLPVPACQPTQTPGWFVEPTIAWVARPSGVAWTTELFGPLAVVVETETFEDALTLANDTEFGLAAAVYTRDRERIRTAVDRLDVGMLSINEPTTGGYPYVPFGGWKSSGFGPREQGDAARQFYTKTKTVHLGR